MNAAMEVRMTALDSVIATPRLVEIDRVDLSAPPGQVWQRVRHAALAHSPVARALFALRTLIDRSDPTARPPGGVHLDNLTRAQVSEDRPPAWSRAWTRAPSAGILRRRVAGSAARGRR